MRSTDILTREHRLLDRLLDELEGLVLRASRLGYVEAKPTTELMNFFEHFSDGLHQEKEERVLFPLLVVRNGGMDGVEIERLAREHAADCRRLSQMRLHLLGAIHGEPGCLEIFVTNARSYIATQKRHLRYEEEHLIPLANRVLSESEDRMALAGFRRVEHEIGGSFEAAALAMLASLAEYQDAMTSVG